MLRILGKILDQRRWTDALIKANIATQGVAESFIYLSHIKKTRAAHQLTALDLYQLQQEAYIIEKNWRIISRLENQYLK